jgi:tRNA (cytidine/uridine-2'-O-)-methyltransferase
MTGVQVAHLPEPQRPEFIVAARVEWFGHEAHVIASLVEQRSATHDDAVGTAGQRGHIPLRRFPIAARELVDLVAGKRPEQLGEVVIGSREKVRDEVLGMGGDAIGVVRLRQPDRVPAGIDAALRVETDEAPRPLVVHGGRDDHHGRVEQRHEAVERIGHELLVPSSWLYIAAVLDIVLVAPQIAVNTGSIVRLCANVGARLHLVEPLGFDLDDRSLRRGGLDYHELTTCTTWPSWEACRDGVGLDRRWFATTAQPPVRRYDEVTFQADDVIAFGCESSGLPPELVATFPVEHRLGIPMRPGNRSLNLAGAVAVVAYEAWRQRDFDGAAYGTTEEARRPRP